MVDTISFTSSWSSFKFLLAFGTIHHVFLQHLDFYLDHATFFPHSGLGGDTWEFHLNLILCIVYICVCVSFKLINFYLWLVLVFLFSRVYYGFTPLRPHTSRHYTSQHIFFPVIFFKFSICHAKCQPFNCVIFIFCSWVVEVYHNATINFKYNYNLNIRPLNLKY